MSDHHTDEKQLARVMRAARILYGEDLRLEWGDNGKKIHLRLIMHTHGGPTVQHRFIEGEDVAEIFAAARTFLKTRAENLIAEAQRDADRKKKELQEVIALVNS